MYKLWQSSSCTQFAFDGVGHWSCFVAITDLRRSLAPARQASPPEQELGSCSADSHFRVLELNFLLLSTQTVSQSRKQQVNQRAQRCISSVLRKKNTP